jgi:hypothetical protein
MITRGMLSVSNPDEGILGAGSYNYACTAIATQNYSSSSVTGILAVTKVPSAINLTLNGQNSDLTVNTGTSVNITSTIVTPAAGQINLTENNSLINSGMSPVSNLTVYNSAGTFIITAKYAGNQNYSSVSSSHILTVQAPSNPPSGGGGGGGGGSSGGGGGGIAIVKPIAKCAESWKCSEWTECSYEGIQIRACNDENKCNTISNKPIEIQSCTRPSCNDSIQNQNELGIDCGGPCPNRCEFKELTGSFVEVPAEEEQKHYIGINIILLFMILIVSVLIVNKFEIKMKSEMAFESDLTKLRSLRNELVITHIAHVIVLICIILLVYRVIIT